MCNPTSPAKHPLSLSLQGGSDASPYSACRTSTSPSACCCLRRPIVITITSPINQALPAAGGTIVIQGRLTNTSGADATITSFGVNFSAQIGSFEALPLVSAPLVLSTGEMTEVLDLFFITGSPSTHPGDAGVPAFGHFSFVAIGTLEGGQLSFLGRSESVNVGIGFTPPRPATFLLLATGLAGIGAVACRRKGEKRVTPIRNQKSIATSASP